MHIRAIRRSVPLRTTAAGVVLITGAGLLAAGCSPGAGSSAASSQGHSVPGAPAARAPAAAQPAVPGGSHLTVLPGAGESIVYTASLTVRAKDVSTAAARATDLATAAGGYTSSENTHLDRAHPARASVSIQLKIPVAAYQPTLARLSSQLGTRVSESQRARDVTQAVADVSSRVASANAAIAQLRSLLAHAGSVSSLLSVQDQINEQEASLEALLSQQRALAHETSYATVSLLLLSQPRPGARHRAAPAGGFTGGLAAGWRALRVTTSWLLTGAGAVLPFAVIAALAGLLAYRGWRWLARRRRPRPAE